MEDEQKLIQKMTPHLQRVMILDSAMSSARMLAEHMRGISSSQSYIAVDGDTAFSLARQIDPQIIFVDLGHDHADGLDLTRKIRRSYFSCRKAPVVAITAQPTVEQILKARDVGVHEFLRKPYNTRDLLRRLEAVTLRPRDWIEAVQYVGPDRRRFNSGDYTGRRKRQSDLVVSDQARIEQALRIVKSALLAMGADPAQALRALRAQVDILGTLGPKVGDVRLTQAAAAFRDFLINATEKGLFNPKDTLLKAGPLVALLPKDKGRAVARTG
ncbi:MAG: hypothetical protein CGW95_02670 [Phenylobacterium zucineum]|nr:MAG: hypothetical protein CGW95_02670 [Phenylobacterium zucineum]